MYLSTDSGEAPIIFCQAPQWLLLFVCSTWLFIDLTRAMITFDGFCTSPVSGRSINCLWLAGLSARTFWAASSLMRLSSRNRSTSSMRTGSRSFSRSFRLLPGFSSFAALLRRSGSGLGSSSADSSAWLLAASLPSELADFFRRFDFPPRSPAGIPGKPMGGMPICCMPIMGGIPIVGMPIGLAIMPIIMPRLIGFAIPDPLPMGHSLVRCGPAQFAQIHLESPPLLLAPPAPALEAFSLRAGGDGDVSRRRRRRLRDRPIDATDSRSERNVRFARQAEAPDEGAGLSQ
mmetsp:Transcript_79813/g.229084  ORF Transcript_79813/g.229084 Transcript_79813/m.229084 type:complete len:289 (+) Transcript_79813:375-1241(+)